MQSGTNYDSIRNLCDGLAVELRGHRDGVHRLAVEVQPVEPWVNVVKVIKYF
jgi:hypothetical protein